MRIPLRIMGLATVGVVLAASPQAQTPSNATIGQPSDLVQVFHSFYKELISNLQTACPGAQCLEAFLGHQLTLSAKNFKAADVSFLQVPWSAILVAKTPYDIGLLHHRSHNAEDLHKCFVKNQATGALLRNFQSNRAAYTSIIFARLHYLFKLATCGNFEPGKDIVGGVMYDLNASSALVVAAEYDPWTVDLLCRFVPERCSRLDQLHPGVWTTCPNGLRWMQRRGAEIVTDIDQTDWMTLLSSREKDEVEAVLKTFSKFTTIFALPNASMDVTVGQPLNNTVSMLSLAQQQWHSLFGVSRDQPLLLQWRQEGILLEPGDMTKLPDYFVAFKGHLVKELEQTLLGRGSVATASLEHALHITSIIFEAMEGQHSPQASQSTSNYTTGNLIPLMLHLPSHTFGMLIDLRHQHLYVCNRGDRMVKSGVVRYDLQPTLNVSELLAQLIRGPDQEALSWPEYDDILAQLVKDPMSPELYYRPLSPSVMGECVSQALFMVIRTSLDLILKEDHGLDRQAIRSCYRRFVQAVYSNELQDFIAAMSKAKPAHKASYRRALLTALITSDADELEPVIKGLQLEGKPLEISSFSAAEIVECRRAFFTRFERLRSLGVSIESQSFAKKSHSWSRFVTLGDKFLEGLLETCKLNAEDHFHKPYLTILAMLLLDTSSTLVNYVQLMMPEQIEGVRKLSATAEYSLFDALIYGKHASFLSEKTCSFQSHAECDSWSDLKEYDVVVPWQDFQALYELHFGKDWIETWKWNCLRDVVSFKHDAILYVKDESELQEEELAKYLLMNLTLLNEWLRSSDMTDELDARLEPLQVLAEKLEGQLEQLPDDIRELVQQYVLPKLL